MSAFNAKQTLVHYFGVLFDRAGIAWGPDNEQEVREAVDAIIDEAVRQAIEPCPSHSVTQTKEGQS